MTANSLKAVPRPVAYACKRAHRQALIGKGLDAVQISRGHGYARSFNTVDSAAAVAIESVLQKPRDWSGKHLVDKPQTI
jgi:hypothetical protein